MVKPVIGEVAFPRLEPRAPTVIKLPFPAILSESCFNSEAYRIGRRAGAERGKKCGAVHFHGFVGNAELERDLFVETAARHELKYLALPLGENCESFARRGTSLHPTISTRCRHFHLRAHKQERLALFVVFFRDGSATPGVEGVAQLQIFAAQALPRLSEIKAIVVAGHSDRTGTASARERIAKRRAEAVRILLISYGIPERSIIASGMGDRQPFRPTGEAVREPLNRRAELTVQFAPDTAGVASSPSTSDLHPPNLLICNR